MSWQACCGILIHQAWISDVANIASAWVMEKAGMRQVARFQRVDEVSGEKEGGYRYTIYDYEWRAQQLFEEERWENGPSRNSGLFET